MAASVEKRAASGADETSAPKKKKQKKVAEVAESVNTAPAAAGAAPDGADAKKKKKKKKSSEGVPESLETASTAASSPEPVPTSSAKQAEAEPEHQTSAAAKAEKKKKKKSKAGGAEVVGADAPTATAAAAEDHSTHAFYSEHNITVSGAPYPLPATSFAASGLPKQVYKACEEQFGKDGKPSPIQAVAWPLILAGKDVFGIAKTGSGKSLAFILPYLANRLEEHKKLEAEGGAAAKKKRHHYPSMVCLAPTKELVQQIAEVANEFTKQLNINLTVHCIIGGVPKYEQIQKIKSSACDLVIATPGRLLDLVENDQVLNLSKCEYFILDEADRMLDDGFILSIRKIADYCTGGSDGTKGDSNKARKIERQTVLFSATWPMEVNKLARGLLPEARRKDPVTITVMRKGDVICDPENINTEDKLQLNDAISQKIHVLEDGRPKWNLLLKTLRANEGKKVLIFGLYKKEVANMETWLKGEGFAIRALQGDMMQDKRTQAIEDFKSNKIRLLVATDVAARGLDIKDIDMVINYTFPLTCEDFVHRCGRTGRAGRKGQAVTFFNSTGEHKEREHCFDIIRLLEGAKQPVPEELRKINANTFTATKKKSHGMYGDFFKSAEEMEKLSKKKVQMTFSDSE